MTHAPTHARRTSPASPSRTDVAGRCPPARRPGRPRDPHLRRRILDATRDVVGEVGPGRVTFTRIAHRAGCGVPAIARRWPSPRALIGAALEDLGGDAADAARLADAGPAAAALAAITTGRARPFVRHVVFASGDDPALAADLERTLLAPMRRRLRAALERDTAPSPVSGGDLDAAVELLQGAVLTAIITGRPVPAGVGYVAIAAPGARPV